jgi:PAS domain S-box-containing protein
MHGSIRERLTLAFIGLAIGPLLLIGIILAWQSFITQEQQALNLQREVAQRVSFQVEAFLDGLEDELRLVSQIQGLQKLDRDRQGDILAELLSYQDAFESLVLLNSQGQEQVRLERTSISLIKPGARVETDEFVIPQTSDQTYYSPVHFNEATGEPFVTIAVPLLDVRTGLVDGVLVSEVRLKRIWDLIMNLRTSPSQSVYIVDAQNKVVVHRNPSVVLGGTTFHVPAQDGIQPGLASVRPMLAMDTREGLSIQSLLARLTSPNVVLAVDTVRFGGQEFNIIAEQTVAEALALAVTTILVTVSLIVAALVISVVLGFVIVRQLVQPIQAMATTAQAISAGDLSRQVRVTSRDEVGVLAVAFNSMTAQLRQNMESLEQQVMEVKQAEESLRRANETLQALIDYSPLAIIMLDLDSHVLLWNNAAEKMYGWTAQEVLGKFIPFVPKDKCEELRAISGRVTQGDVFTDLELDRRRKDGSRILIAASIAPLRDSMGSVYAHMSIATDITKRKKVEEALRESEERLRQIASSLREVIWLRDAQTRQVLYVNPAFEELLGWTCESFYKNPDIVIEALHPDDKEWVIKALGQRFEGVSYDTEHRIIHLDGNVRWVSSRSFPVLNEAGEVYRWASIMEDITERKRAEEEIRRLNEELEQRVVERTAQLEAANKELEAFSYSISHDLRTPLRAIDGFSRILMEDHAGELSPDAARYLTIIRENTQQMGHLIDDLLAFSRLSRQPLSKRAVAMTDLVRQALDGLSGERAGRQVELVLGDLPACQGDPALLRQVWLNLLSNALKFTRKRELARIEVGSVEKDGEQVYFVKDDGTGFDMQYVGKLFGVFHRLHRAEEYEGTGVGLAIVQRIVARHGGRVWAEAEVDKGATFYFTI